MYVHDLAETRIEDRVYGLRAEKEGQRLGWSVEIVQDEEGAGTHDRVITDYLGFKTYAEAQRVYLALVRVAMHHGGTDPFASA